MRQVHGRLSHEQILDPLHLGLLEQDLGQIIPFSVAKRPVAPSQDIACGVDRNGKDVKIVNLQQTLLKCDSKNFRQ